MTSKHAVLFRRPTPPPPPTTTTSTFEPFFADNEYCRRYSPPFGAVVSGTYDLGGPQDIVDLGEDPSDWMAEAFREDHPTERHEIPPYHEGAPFHPPRRRGVVEDRAPEVEDVLRACEVVREHWPQFNGLWSEEELMAFVQCGGDERLDLHDYERVHLRLYCQGYYPSPEGLPDHTRSPARRRQRRRRGGRLRRASLGRLPAPFGILRSNSA